MKYVFLIILCLVILWAGYTEIRKQRHKTSLIDQGIRLISHFRTELNYRKSDCEALYNSAVESGFNCVAYENGKIIFKVSFPSVIEQDMSSFFQRLGTTDADSQVALCDEYIQRIKPYLDEQREIEKSKTQVDFAVSILGVFCVIVLFV